MAVVVLALATACVAMVQEVVAQVVDRDTVRINGITVDPASSLADAERAAKHAAVRRMLDRRGSAAVPAQVRRAAEGAAAELVSTRRILNAEPTNGLYQPAFYFDVDMSRIDRMIQTANSQSLDDYGLRPRMLVAVSVSQLPKAFNTDADRARFSKAATDVVGERARRAGFEVIDPGDSLRALVRSSAPAEQIQQEMYKDPSAEYFIVGEIGLSDRNLRSRDGGAYYVAAADVAVRTTDTVNRNIVPSSRNVEGTGETDDLAVRSAVDNASRLIIDKMNAPDLLESFKLNFKRGIEWEIRMCTGWRGAGAFMAKIKEKYQVVGGGGNRVSEIYKVTSPPGKFVHPYNILDNIRQEVAETLGYREIQILPQVLDGVRRFAISDDPRCVQ